MLPVMVCDEGFLLSHTSEVVDVPGQAAVDAFVPPFTPPEEWLLDPAVPHAFSELPEPARLRRVPAPRRRRDEEARSVIEQVAAEFATPLRAAEGRGASASPAIPAPEPRSSPIGTIGDTALELLEDDDDLLVVRVHAYRPFPAGRAGGDAFAARVTSASVDRAPAFGSFGPLGGDVRVAPAVDARDVTNVICGIGGTEVTPDTLRWALRETRSSGPERLELEPVFVPEGV